jgi:hypothetical protein
MTRALMSLALLVALAGCEEKKEAAPPSAVVPATGAAVVPSGAAASGEAVAPSGAAASGEAAKPSGEAAKPSGEAAKPSGEAAKPSGAKASKSGAATKAAPPISGGMPHGNPEDGTLKYNPPPAQNPPAKK